MAKRFTDPNKWNDPWFCELSVEHKIVWTYLLDSCDHAGIWKVNIRMAKFMTGVNFEETPPASFADRVITNSSGYWFIPKFLTFQYGDNLNRGAAVKSAINEVVKHGFYKAAVASIGDTFTSVAKVFLRGSSTPKATATATAKATAMAVVKDVKGGVGGPQILEWFEKTWKEYPKDSRVGKKAALRHYQGTVKSLEDARACANALGVYLQSERVKRGFVQNASTWFNDWEAWKHDQRRDSPRFARAETERAADLEGPRSGGFVTAARALDGVADALALGSGRPKDHGGTGRGPGDGEVLG